MDVMLAVMRDPHVALDMRVKMALKALPHLHRKLRAGESASVADQSLPPGRRRNLSPNARRVDGASIGQSVNEAAATKSDGATSINGEKSSNVARATGALAGVLAEIPEREGDNGTGLMPLPFLLGVLNDAKAPAAIRVKVASSTLPYTHPSTIHSVG